MEKKKKYEQALNTIARLTVPEILEENLVKASLFLTAYELLRFSVQDQLCNIYINYRLSLSPEERDKAYNKEVLALEKHPFAASLKWYQNEGLLSPEDVKKIQKLREIRNSIAHRLPQLLSEPDSTLDLYKINVLESLVSKLDRWFVRNYEIPIIEELNGKDIPDDEIISGNMAVLILIKKTLSKKYSDK